MRAKVRNLRGGRTSRRRSGNRRYHTGKPLPIARPLKISKDDSPHGTFSLAPYADPDDDARQGWAVTQKINGRVTMERNVVWPIKTLTVVAPEGRPKPPGVYPVAAE